MKKNYPPRKLRDILEASPFLGKPDYKKSAPTGPFPNEIHKPHFKHTEDPIYKDIQKNRQMTPEDDTIGHEILNQKEKDFYKDPKKLMTQPLDDPGYDPDPKYKKKMPRDMMGNDDANRARDEYEGLVGKDI